MWRFPSAVNIKEWTEVAICILAHHLVCDHFLREFPADCNPWQYLYFDLQLFRKLFDYFFFLGQQEHTYFAVFCRRVMLPVDAAVRTRSEEHTSELQSRENLVCRLLLEKKNK